MKRESDKSTKTNTGMRERSFSGTPYLSIVIDRYLSLIASYIVENNGGKVGWLPQGSKLIRFGKIGFFCICGILFELECYIII
jgi:hypothetical protein